MFLRHVCRAEFANHVLRVVADGLLSGAAGIKAGMNQALVKTEDERFVIACVSCDTVRVR